MNTVNNEEVIVSDENGVSVKIVETSIAKVAMSPAMMETPEFQKVLLDIPVKIDNADKLLKDYRSDPIAFLENTDEESINTQIQEMAVVSTFVSDVEKSKKEIRAHVNGIRDEVIRRIDDRLVNARYDELERAQSDIKQLKKDVSADRMARRWDELKDTFQANMNRYPLFTEFAPELMDFNRFKLIYPKLISGAKTRVVRKADHTKVNETVYAWNTAIELIKENEWGLTVHELNQLLTLFKQNPSVELVNREGRQLKLNADAKEKARLEAETRRNAQIEAARVANEKRKVELEAIQKQAQIAKAAQDKQAQANAEKQRLELEQRALVAQENEKKLQAEFEQFGGQYRTVFKESFPMFIKYLFSVDNYHDVHSNPSTKAAIIYDIMKQVDNAESVVVKETANSPQKVLDLVRYILDAW